MDISKIPTMVKAWIYSVDQKLELEKNGKRK